MEIILYLLVCRFDAIFVRDCIQVNNLQVYLCDYLKVYIVVVIMSASQFIMIFKIKEISSRQDQKQCSMSSIYLAKWGY